MLIKLAGTERVNEHAKYVIKAILNKLAKNQWQQYQLIYCNHGCHLGISTLKFVAYLKLYCWNYGNYSNNDQGLDSKKGDKKYKIISIFGNLKNMSMNLCFKKFNESELFEMEWLQ